MESYQSLETNKGYGRQREKLWGHQKKQNIRCILFQSTCRTCLFNRRTAKRSMLVEKAVPTCRQTNASTNHVNQSKIKTNIGKISPYLLFIYASERAEIISETYLNATIE